MIKKLLIGATSALALMAGTASAQNWSGFYAGGFALTGTNSTDTNPFVYENSDISFGVFAGYNFATSSNIVYGIEAEYDAANYANSAIWPYGVKSAYGLRGRVGYTMGDAMVYGVLGVQSGTYGIMGTTGADEQLTGYAVGAGLEYFISSALSVRGEYIYTDYGDNSNLFPGFSISSQAIRLGAAYHF